MPRKLLPCLFLILLTALPLCAARCEGAVVLPDYGAHAGVEPVGASVSNQGDAIRTYEARSLDKINAFVKAVQKEFGFIADRQKTDTGEIIRLQHAYAPGFSIAYQKAQKLAVFVYPKGTQAGDFEAARLSMDTVIPYVFADNHMEAMVRKLIGKPDGQLTVAELKQIKALDFNTLSYDERKAVQDVSDLSVMTGLEELNLQATGIADLTALKGLTSLRSLNLAVTDVEDLRPLAGLTQLEALNIAVTNVTTLAGLEKLTNLRELSAHNAEIANVAAVSSLVSLDSLDLAYNHIKALPNMSKLTNLRILYISNNNISDLTPVGKLANLSLLMARKNTIKKIDPLAKLENLSSAYLHDNPIASLEPLSNKKGKSITFGPDFLLDTRYDGNGMVTVEIRESLVPEKRVVTKTFTVTNKTKFLDKAEESLSAEDNSSASFRLRPFATYAIEVTPLSQKNNTDITYTVPADKYGGHGWKASKTGLFLFPAGAPIDGFLGSFAGGSLSDMSAALLTRGQIDEIVSGKQVPYLISSVRVSDASAWQADMQLVIIAPNGDQLWQEGRSYTNNSDRTTLYDDLRAYFAAMVKEYGSLPYGEYTVHELIDYEIAATATFKVVY